MVLWSKEIMYNGMYMSSQNLSNPSYRFLHVVEYLFVLRSRIWCWWGLHLLYCNRLMWLEVYVVIFTFSGYRSPLHIYCSYTFYVHFPLFLFPLLSSIAASAV